MADGPDCPSCGCSHSDTRDSRNAMLGDIRVRRRRRKCTRCANLFTTYEITAEAIASIEAAIARLQAKITHEAETGRDL